MIFQKTYTFSNKNFYTCMFGNNHNYNIKTLKLSEIYLESNFKNKNIFLTIPEFNNYSIKITFEKRYDNTFKVCQTNNSPIKISNNNIIIENLNNSNKLNKITLKFYDENNKIVKSSGNFTLNIEEINN